MAVVHIPDPSLVVLIGAAGSGKSTFAARHFAEAEIVSSDRLRVAVSGRVDDMGASADAFTLLHAIARMRLGRGLLTVADATSVLRASRRILVEIASRRSRPAVAIVLDLPEEVVLARNAARARTVPEDAVRRQIADLRRSADTLKDEGFASVCWLLTPSQIDETVVER